MNWTSTIKRHDIKITQFTKILILILVKIIDNWEDLKEDTIKKISTKDIFKKSN